MAWTLCTSGAAVAKAGTHCNSVSGSETEMAEWSNEAEGSVCVLTNTDWITTYTSLSTPVKNCLADITSSMVAMSIISYDTTGYLSREADTLLNRNDEVITKGLSKLDGKADKLKTP